MLARAFGSEFSQHEGVCIYAAGVSNSGCTEAHEFARERQRLQEALQAARHVDAFVYFGTCSVGDPDLLDTPYVRHKLAMEQIVGSHPRNLILRLPQAAGKTPNPHTLLNYLYAHIARSESFKLWGKARRNIIDVDDVAAIAACLIADGSIRNVTLNIANPISYSMFDIVGAMERVTGKRAVYSVLDRGSDYPIEISAAVLSGAGQAGVAFGNDYLNKVIKKYYSDAGDRRLHE